MRVQLLRPGHHPKSRIQSRRRTELQAIDGTGQRMLLPRRSAEDRRELSVKLCVGELQGE